MKARRGERGLGLIELLISLAITGSILSVLGLTLVSVIKNSATGRDQQSATHQLRNGFFWVNQDTQSGVASRAIIAPGDVTMQWTDYSTGTAYSSRLLQVGSELQRTITVNGVPATRVIARNLLAGGFTATQSGNAVTYNLTVQNGSTTQSRTETTTMRVAAAPITPFPTVTYSPTPTPTNTSLATSTSSATSTPTSTPTMTPTPTPTNTRTNTPTNTATSTATPTSTSTPTATPTATPSGSWFQTGTYTGNGSAGRTISGVNFQPDIVIIRSSTTDDAVIRTSSMPVDMAKDISSGNNLGVNLVTSFGANRFVIGNDTLVNSNGATYYWTAMKAGINVAVGTYTGDGTGNRNITGVAFQPAWVMTIGDGEEDYFRPALVAGDASFSIAGSGARTNRIQSILANGFQIGSDANVNGSGLAYYWIAFNATPQVVAGSYTGNGADNRNITGLGITPGFVWTKRSSSSMGVWRTDAVPGDSTLFWDNTNPATNRIQSIISDGFQVGTNAQANSNGSTYYYLALSDTAAPATPTSTPTPTPTGTPTSVNTSTSTPTSTPVSATIALRSASSNAAASGSLTINKPAGTVANDVLIAGVAVRPQNGTITAPAGWTLIRRLDNPNPNQSSLVTYYKVAGASEPASYTWSFSTSTGAAGGIQAFSGVKTSNPIDVEGGQNTPNGVAHSTPSITTTVANDMLVTVHAFTSSASWTPPAGMTEAYQGASLAIPNCCGISLEGNYVVQAAIGATGAKTATASNDADAGNAQIIALRPGP